MKKKLPNNRAPKNSQSRDATEIPLPEPMELAKLAAILRPGAKNRADALKAAMEWYFDAVLVAREQTKLEEELLKRSRRRLLHLIALRYLRGVPAQARADTVDLDEARRLLADPRKLAEKLGKLPKEGEPQPEPKMKVETALYELPGIPFEELKTKPALVRNVVLGYEYMRRKFGKGYGYTVSPRDVRGIGSGDNFEKRFKELFEVEQGVYKIPTIVLEGVLRYRYESHLESDRQYQRRKSRKQGRDKAVK